MRTSDHARLGLNGLWLAVLLAGCSSVGPSPDARADEAAVDAPPAHVDDTTQRDAAEAAVGPDARGEDAGVDAVVPTRDDGVPPGALTYLEDIHPMFEAAGCSTFACHGSTVGGFGVLLYMPDARTAYNDMINRVSVRRPEALVRPRAPNESVLVEHADNELIMNAILTREQAARVREWVAAGAFYSRSGASPDGGGPEPGDGGVTPGDGGAGPAVCSLAAGRGMPALPPGCLPRCTRATWEQVAACRTAPNPAMCQNAAMAADPTIAVQLVGGAEPISVSCSVCVNWQTRSCLDDFCRFALLAFDRCNSTRPGDPCSAEASELQRCVALAPGFRTCQRDRDALCAATE